MAILQEREKKKAEAMEKTAFYRFQGREKRKKEAEDLVNRFQEDQKKVQALRHRKGLSGFKPEEWKTLLFAKNNFRLTRFYPTYSDKALNSV